jgi:hypothetical protein
MDAYSFLHIIVVVLIAALLLTVAYLIIKRFIMPAIEPQAQLYVWAVIGILLLLFMCYVFISFIGGHGDALTLRH